MFQYGLHEVFQYWEITINTCNVSVFSRWICESVFLAYRRGSKDKKLNGNWLKICLEISEQNLRYIYTQTVFLVKVPMDLVRNELRKCFTRGGFLKVLTGRTYILKQQFRQIQKLLKQFENQTCRTFQLNHLSSHQMASIHFQPSSDHKTITNRHQFSFACLHRNTKVPAYMPRTIYSIQQ